MASANRPPLALMDTRDFLSIKNSKLPTPESSEACAMITVRAKGSFAPSRGWSNQVVGPGPPFVQLACPIKTAITIRKVSFFIIPVHLFGEFWYRYRKNGRKFITKDFLSIRNSKLSTPESSEACAMITVRAKGSFVLSSGWSNQVVGPEPAVVQAINPDNLANNNRAMIESFLIPPLHSLEKTYNDPT
jgi:hypothetical protein